jgi:predicted SprT family Zn-dependent metalloprotease
MDELVIDDIFTAEDFTEEKSQRSIGQGLLPYQAAHQANARFREIAKGWKTVGYDITRDAWTQRNSNSSHTGFIAFEQEIKRECAHEPEMRLLLRDPQIAEYFCKHCKAKLKATWGVADV